jgi:hypothetical protein
MVVFISAVSGKILFCPRYLTLQQQFDYCMASALCISLGSTRIPAVVVDFTNFEMVTEHPSEFAPQFVIISQFCSSD